jgi:hypothetical protein
MTDDFLITLQHEDYLLMVLMVSVHTAIKTDNPLLFQGAMSDQVGTTSLKGTSKNNLLCNRMPISAHHEAL